MNLDRVAIAEGHSQSAVSDLRTAIQQADAIHLKYYWLRASVDLAEALVNNKDYAHARQELETALNRSEKIGLRLQTARIHYLLGKTLQHLGGDAADADRQYQLAHSMFEELTKDPGAEHILDRSDLHPMYAEVSRITATAK